MSAKRLLAIFLDWLVISTWAVLLLLIALAMGRLFPGLLERLYADWPIAQILSFCLLPLPVIVSFGMMESSKWKATVGKKFAGLQLHHNGERLSPSRAIARNAIKFLPWEIAHTGFYLFQFKPDWHGVALFLSVLSLGLFTLWIVPIFVSVRGVSVPDLICGTRHKMASSP